MTRENAKELLPIIQAFVEGKKIEYSNDGENWIETETPTWDTDFVYRIKPQQKYRPFKSQEECWNEMMKHQPFGWVTDKCKYVHISSIFKDEIECNPDEDDDGNLLACIIKFTSVYEQGYTFADGEPFGIKVE